MPKVSRNRLIPQQDLHGFMAIYLPGEGVLVERAGALPVKGESE
jgi:hypothetical protein